MGFSLLLTILILVIILAAVVEGKKKPCKGKKCKGNARPSKPSNAKPSKPSKAKPSKKPSKLSKEQKANIKTFNRLKKDTGAMTKAIEELTKQIEAAEKLAEVSDRHVVGTNAIVVVDAHYTGNQCGQFTLTSFSNNLNVYLTAARVTGTAPFSSGTFTAPVAGWYHICSFSRFKNGGNSNDVTILSGGSTVIGGYGNAVTYDWRSTGICIDEFLAANTQVTVKHQSGGGS